MRYNRKIIIKPNFFNHISNSRKSGTLRTTFLVKETLILTLRGESSDDRAKTVRIMGPPKSADMFSRFFLSSFFFFFFFQLSSNFVFSVRKKNR